MKQVTGNNITEALASQSILSIQQSLDGLSFCVSRFGQPLWLHKETGKTLKECYHTLAPLQKNYPRVRVIIDTDQSCLIPEAYFDEEAAPIFMQTHGFAPHPDTELKIIRREKFVWLLQASHSFLQELAECFAQASIEYLHPLWIGIRRASAGNFTDIHLSQSTIHVVLHVAGALRYADTLSCLTPADLLYLLNEIPYKEEIQKSTLIFSGQNAEFYKKHTAVYYKKTTIDRLVPAKNAGSADIPFFANLIRAAYENY